MPALERNAPAAVINVLTLIALAPMGLMAGYSASKAAAHSITQALRAELRPRSVSVLGAPNTKTQADLTPPEKSGTRRYASRQAGTCVSAGTGWSAVVGVFEVEPASGVPFGSLVAVGGDAAGVLEHPGQVHQVPGHEGGVAVGEVVAGAA